MIRTRSTVRAAPLVALATLLPLGAAAQQKPALTVDDYGPWKEISSVALSDDGAWMAYVYEPLEGDDTLFVRGLEAESVHAVPRGSSPAFSEDGRWAGWLVSSPEEEGGGSGEAGPARGSGDGDGHNGPPARTLVLRNLESGDSATFADVASFSFPDGAGVALVRKRGPGGDADHEGADLVVYGPDTGEALNLGNVSEYAVSEAGSHLAWLVDAADDAGNGLYVMELGARTVVPVDTDPVTYSELAWTDDGHGLAALRGEAPDGKEQRENTLLVLRDARTPGALERLDPSGTGGFPDGFVLSEKGSLRWSDDGSRLFVGIKEQRDDREPREGRADVDVWHWADVEVQSIQKVRAERERNRTWDAVVNLTDGGLRFVRLADETLESVTPAGDSRWAVGRDPRRYEREVTWGGSRADYWRVDLDSGEREPMAEGIGRQMGTSPDGEWWLFLRDEHVVARRLATGEEVDLTASTGIDFVDRQDDHPYELPVHGVAGWSTDGRVLLYDRFDVWAVPLDGSAAANLTAGVGERERIRFRVTEFRDGDDRGGFGGFGSGGRDEPIDLDEPLLLDAYSDRTKRSGFWEVVAGGEPESRYWQDERVGRPLKAEDADRIAFTRETFGAFPDYWTATTRFAGVRRITHANPQQADFAWTPGRVLIDYVDDRGHELQATLTLPAGYVEGRRYPMLVYFYETMSQRHHAYQGPRYDDRPHIATYASQGYLVLQPDIVYTIGQPGTSALDDLTAAVEKVVELGYTDPERIGLQGHSWGGYQSSFVVTQTDLFAAVVTGAPPTNLVSFYNTLYKRIGSVQQGITEVGQVRMGTTPFEDFDLYVSQSPVHQAENITTPFMILHGTEDGAVDWMQGLEYYNMARRLGKEVILVSYPGEPHHLAEKENQIDFQIRMNQFFDHHLKGAPAARWMVEGVDYLDREHADVREMVDDTTWGKAGNTVTEEQGGQGGPGR